MPTDFVSSQWEDFNHNFVQVLISEAGAAPSVAKTKKEASSSSKEGKTGAMTESHVEMDSRLLSALLTVSKSHLLFLSLNLHIFLHIFS